MSISPYPSKLSLPEHSAGHRTIFDFLVDKFPLIDATIWRQRFLDGKIHTINGQAIRLDAPYQARLLVYYYREVTQEDIIPVTEEILFEDEHILLAYKPHFLPVTPGGRFINECLQHRLRQTTGLNQLQAIHRIDRDTAGLVLFSKQVETRAHYHALFKEHKIKKHYQAISAITTGDKLLGQHWQVKNCIVRSEPRFLMKIDTVSNKPNSHSDIRCLKQTSQQALFELRPITGKTHQLRLHMMSIGLPIMNDKNYPKLQPKQPDNFNKPLQLLAKRLQFIDPINGKLRDFNCHHTLSLTK